MMKNIWFIAAIWIGLALVASLISIRVGISVALIEILVGVAAGNIHLSAGQQLLRSTDWTNFLARWLNREMVMKITMRMGCPHRLYAPVGSEKIILSPYH